MFKPRPFGGSPRNRYGILTRSHNELDSSCELAKVATVNSHIAREALKNQQHKHHFKWHHGR